MIEIFKSLKTTLTVNTGFRPEPGGKAAVAISGGVDSGVAAALLVEQGYEVVGLTMRHLDGMAEQLKAAEGVAAKLGIPFYTIDFRGDFF